MSTPSSSTDREFLDVAVFHDGVFVGRGKICPMGAAYAFVRIADFPLGADSFLELSLVTKNRPPDLIPVRVLANTGDGLEVELEGNLPTWATTT
jgi:hypothetical protein